MTPAALELPALPLDEWEPTKETLHLWSQIVGKIQLATTPPRNHWWNVTLRVDTRGLRSQRLHTAGVTFDVAFDFVDHRLVVRTHRGEVESFALEDGLSVAAFDERLHDLLSGLGIDVAIREEPFGIAATTPFRDDTEHASYDPEYAHRFWRALDWIDSVLEEFAGWYCGKTSPVQLFWHSFDLAVSRFSGVRAADAEGADPVTREAYSHDVISFGFWAGDPNVREPTFYSYTAPEPAGLRDQPLRPGGAHWVETPTGSIAQLPYEVVRSASDPRAALLAFLQSAYEGGAQAAGWDRDALVSSFCPSPRALVSILER
jgi:hypothetical protein